MSIVPARPRVPAHLLKHYVLAAPRSTHWRPATCEEVRCSAFVDGWTSVFDESTELGRAQADYVRGKFTLPNGEKCGRKYTEYRRENSTLVTFRFFPGQKPFGDEHDNHAVPLGRPAIFAVIDPQVDNGTPYIHDGVENGAVNWTDDFANHQDRLADKAKEG